MRSPSRGVIELLESRIAPAAVLLSIDGKVKYPVALKAATVASLQLATTQVDADLAVILEAGNTLCLDLNGDGKYSSREDGPALVQAKAGRAVVYLTEQNGDGTLDANDLSGVRASNGFNGVISADVHGSIVTGLSAVKNEVGVATAKASLAGLVVNGVVEGSLLASGGMAKVSITGLGEEYSVGMVKSGSAAEGESYWLGARERELSYVSGGTAAQGLATITNLSLAGGTRMVQAGDGGGISKVVIAQQRADLELVAGIGWNGGAGGNVSGINISQAGDGISLLITAGAGGGNGGRAGDGGSVNDVRVMGGKLKAVTIEAGEGADVDAETAVAGRAGGSVMGVELQLQALEMLQITAANGAAGGVKYNASYEVVDAGAGGAGGSIADVHLVAAEGATWVSLQAGNGAASGDGEHGLGGNGGSLGNSKAARGIELLGVGSVELRAGVGEAGALGGKGGAVQGVTMLGAGDDSVMAAAAGVGGDGRLTAGAGGGLAGLVILGGSFSDVNLTAGAAGSILGESASAGASGGSLQDIAILTPWVQRFALVAGHGGDGGTRTNAEGEIVAGGAGGAGGRMVQVELGMVLPGGEGSLPEVTLQAGNGGAGQFARAGGMGGGIAKLAVWDYSAATVVAGNGGAASWGGSAGAGGDIAGGLILQGAGTLVLQAGRGGDGVDGAAGGRGGAILGESRLLAQVTTGSGSVSLRAGDGGGGSARFSDVTGAVAQAGAGGVGGAISYLSVKSTAGLESLSIEVRAGAGGSGGGNFAGGSGGAVRSIAAWVPEGITELAILAGRGGDADAYGTLPAAGVGGSLAEIRLTGPQWLKTIAALQAGEGGWIEDARQASHGTVTGVVYSLMS